MKNRLYATSIASLTVLLLQAGAACAQTTAVGLWRTIDDSTGKPRGEVRITETSNGLSGRLVRSLAADPSKESSTCKGLKIWFFLIRQSLQGLPLVCFIPWYGVKVVLKWECKQWRILLYV